MPPGFELSEDSAWNMLANGDFWGVQHTHEEFFPKVGWRPSYSVRLCASGFQLGSICFLRAARNVFADLLPTITNRVVEGNQNLNLFY